MSPFILAVCFLAAVTLGQAAQSTLNLTYADGTVKTYYAGVEVISLDPPILEMCYDGPWLTYSSQYYGFGTVTYSSSSFQSCVYGTQRSARPAGVLEDYTIPSVTFYTATSYNGPAVVATGDRASLPFPIFSFITLFTKVQLFSEENFGGLSYCAERRDNPCEHDMCAFVSTAELQSPLFDLRAAKSVKIGCTRS